MDRLQTMKAFVHVVEEAGFTAAARKLGVDQALVTRQVADLEQHLGTKLLERTTRSVRLTEAGEIFLARCRSILADMAEAEAEVGRSYKEMAGRVRIALPTVFSATDAAHQITKLHEEFPDITVEMAMTDSAFDPVAEAFDVATVDATHSVSVTAVARPLLEVPYILCGAPDYFRNHPMPTTPGELSEHYCVAQWISGEADHPRECWTFDGPDGTHESVSIPVALRANTYALSVEAVRCGIGLGRLPGSLVSGDIASGRLLAILPDWHPGQLSFKLVYPGRRMMPRRVRHVIDAIFAQRDEAATEETAATKETKLPPDSTAC